MSLTDRCARALRAVTSWVANLCVPAESFTRQSVVDVLYVDSAGRVVAHRRGIKFERFMRL